VSKQTAKRALARARQARHRFEIERQELRNPVHVKRAARLPDNPDREDVAKLLRDEVRGMHRMIGKRFR
jgi:hypothetical protein